MINIALPKGRLGEKAYAMFEAAGYECPSIREENRKLIFAFFINFFQVIKCFGKWLLNSINLFHESFSIFFCDVPSYSDEKVYKSLNMRVAAPEAGTNL